MKYLLTLLAIGLSLPVLAQTNEGAVPPSSESTYGRDVATPIIGDSPTASWGEQIRRTNFFLTDFRASTHIDDNALNNNNSKIVDAIFTFEPRFAWKLARSRWNWALDYSPQLSYSVNIPNYSNVAHRLNTAFQVTPSNRLSVRIRNAFTRTEDPF